MNGMKLAVVAGLVLGGSGLALAQDMNKTPALKSQAEARRVLQQHGYYQIGSIARRGPQFTANALKDGEQVSVSIDARTGKVEEDER